MNPQGLLGIAAILALAWALGEDRRRVKWRVVATGLGLQISSAKISTYGERVVDVFYVKDVFGMKVEHEDKLRTIRERLVKALDEPEPETGGAANEPASAAE